MPIDIYRAKAKMFQIIDGKLMPSLASIEGMGDKAAEAVEEASKDGPYLSLDDFRQSQDISFLKKFLERITPDCTAFICEDDFIAWLLWEELSLGQEKKIATHASLSSSLQSTGFKTTSADHSFETTIALATLPHLVCSAPQH